MKNGKGLRVKVETLPNGYALTVNGEEYMYFNGRELLAGMFYHVGLEKLDYIDADHVEMLMEAILTWPSIQEAAQGQAVQMKELKEARQDLYKTRRQLAEIDNRLQDEKATVRELNSKLFVEMKRRERDNDLQSRLSNALDSLNKLNVRNIKTEKKSDEQAHEIASLKRELAKYRRLETAGGEKKEEPAVSKVDHKKFVRTRKDADAVILEELERQQHNNND